MGKGFITWGGGIDFLRFCMNALICRKEVELVLFLPIDRSLKNRIKNVLRPIKYALLDIKNGAIPQYHSNNITDIKAVAKRFQMEYEKIDIVMYSDNKKGLIKQLKKNKIDVLIPSIESLEKNFPYPWVGYLFDFQHKYYPEFFSNNDIDERNKSFENMVMDAKAVIVNSEAVKNDIYKFYPSATAKVFNLPFAPIPKEKWLKINSILLNKYQLPKKYFMISNQFWIHKDHKTAFRALALMQAQGYKEYEIVCSGKTYDHRFPNYFNELTSEIESLGVADRVKFLGYIPKLDQIEIMKNSIAVIQPTLFEGGPGGGAVYDAVAIGIPVIASDIDVNKEINNDNVVFFKSNTPEDLSRKMIERINAINKSAIDRNMLIKVGEHRLNLVGERLMESLEFIVKR